MTREKRMFSRDLAVLANVGALTIPYAFVTAHRSMAYGQLIGTEGWPSG